MNDSTKHPSAQQDPPTLHRTLFSRLARSATSLILMIAVGCGKADSTGKTPLRPEILDRNGVLLVGNRKDVKPNQRRRLAAQDGKFAAAALGYTAINDQHEEVGMAGVERMIDQGLPQGVLSSGPSPKLYLTLDLTMQTELENLMETIYRQATPEYTHAVVIRGNGEILALAQRPVLDINDRSHVKTLGTGNLSSTYVFPVADALMKCLNSSSAALPKEKEKFQFVEKLNLFPGEARGRVLGLKPQHETQESGPELPEETITPQKAAKVYAGQMTSVLHFLRAYAGVAEQKPLPTLSILVPHEKLPCEAVGKPSSLTWSAVVRSKNGITVTALGIIRSNTKEPFYLLIRSVHGYSHPAEKDSPNATRDKERKNADIAERLIRAWTFKN